MCVDISFYAFKVPLAASWWILLLARIGLCQLQHDALRVGFDVLRDVATFAHLLVSGFEARARPCVRSCAL